MQAAFGTWAARQGCPGARGGLQWLRRLFQRNADNRNQTPAGPALEDWAAGRSGRNQRDDRGDLGRAPLT
ncbi:hypothetical protein NDU88_003322 [Pleurodeles waltl]|uniref:Uncharacterized protein n=1 Tax=Pleurodeles waltl TaxID=8319 RepID=A0AAV7UD05_PLEWA|nr:hypothetical protein NDU88_003322 [Pleurodeles waltl]